MHINEIEIMGQSNDDEIRCDIQRAYVIDKEQNRWSVARDKKNFSMTDTRIRLGTKEER